MALTHTLGQDGILRIILARPHRLNAVNEELARGFAEATGLISEGDVRAVLLAGEGTAFCSGGDVIAMATETGPGEHLTRLAHVINRGLLALLESSVPVVAAAHGTTAGGGLGLLLASDYAIVGHNSRIGALYSNIGLTPDLSVTALLGRAVGERRALQLLLSDTMLSAQQAREWGLVAEVVGSAEMTPGEIAAAVRARAEEVAAAWASGANGAYGQAKRLVRSRPTRTLAEQLEEEARSIGAAFDTPDARSLIQAFAARTGARS